MQGGKGGVLRCRWSICRIIGGFTVYIYTQTTVDGNLLTHCIIFRHRYIWKRNRFIFSCLFVYNVWLILLSVCSWSFAISSDLLSYLLKLLWVHQYYHRITSSFDTPVIIFLLTPDDIWLPGNLNSWSKFDVLWHWHRWLFIIYWWLKKKSNLTRLGLSCTGIHTTERQTH